MPVHAQPSPNTVLMCDFNGYIDPEGRSYKNTLKLMTEDGMFQILPKSDDAWIKFFNPFLRLTRKEKNKKIIKIKNYEQ